MAKPLKSQWTFGELFPPEATRRVLTVSELTLTVKRLVEGQVGRIWVTGEITNCRVQGSGHAYFSVKDAGSQLSCVLFRDEARGFRRDLLQDGQKVVLNGEMTVYEARGQYQLRVSTVELQGVGALQAAFERLKQKLNAEGLFASERKRPLPPFPQRLGVVTSPTAAAFRDVLHVIERRHPGLEIVLAPCRVQGQGAAEEIAAAIRDLNQWSRRSAGEEGVGLDLILVTRGGGSLEDLWAFNEEVVARAIFESALPVISAVGHEIDFTISDFVADVRAATPSAAAEIITEGPFSSRQFVSSVRDRMEFLVRRRLAEERERWEGLQARIQRVHPQRRVRELAQRLDDLEAGLQRNLRFGTRAWLGRWQAVAQRLQRVRPSRAVAERRERLDRLRSALLGRVEAGMARWRAVHETVAARLRLLSPQNVLERGYSITVDDATGRVIREASTVRAGQRLRTRLRTGEIRSTADGPGAV